MRRINRRPKDNLVCNISAASIREFSHPLRRPLPAASMDLCQILVFDGSQQRAVTVTTDSTDPSKTILEIIYCAL